MKCWPRARAMRARARAGGGAACEQPRLLLIDNYDSFTYNLVQASWCSAPTSSVYRNDAITRRAGAGARADAPVHLARARHAARRRHLDGR